MADGLDVRFLGAVPHIEIPHLMKSAFACILPSFWEGIPTVGLEAMASGTPFIGTKVGGIPELVDSDVNGILVSPNAPLDIANAIQKLENNSFRNKLILNASHLIKKRFSIDIIAKNTENLYKKII